MKKIYTHTLPALVLSLIFSNCRSQPYVPFPDSGAVWNVNNWYTDGTYAYFYFESLYYPGNTITALGNTYKEVYKSGMESITLMPNGPTTYINYNQSTGYALRQDAALHMVYVYTIINATESIFIDFNLQVGDTLTNSKIWWANSNFQVTSIDSELIGSSYRKRYNFEGINSTTILNQDTSIIEGIGSTSGLFWGPDIFEGGGDLQCFSLFNNQLYPVFGTSPCGINSIAENTGVGEVKVYTDLDKQVLTIETPESFKNYDYFIADISGKKIVSGKSGSQKNSIGTASFSKGAYLIHINAKGKSFVKKFIIT